jgi:hypothetical protein
MRVLSESSENFADPSSGLKDAETVDVSMVDLNSKFNIMANHNARSSAHSRSSFPVIAVLRSLLFAGLTHATFLWTIAHVSLAVSEEDRKVFPYVTLSANLPVCTFSYCLRALRMNLRPLPVGTHHGRCQGCT